MKKVICVVMLLFVAVSSTCFAKNKNPTFYSEAVLVKELNTSNILYSKNVDKLLSIASITKLLTAVIIIDGDQDLNELITITNDDVDVVKHSHSRLTVGEKIPRYHLLYIMLMSSDNRAAHALARNYYCDIRCFNIMMNSYAFVTSMNSSKFEDPTGLTSKNVSTANDLFKLIEHAKTYPMISMITSTPFGMFYTKEDGETFNNTNKFLKIWDILLSKTGYIKESGYCISMVTKIDNKDYVIVVLNATSKNRRSKDLVKIVSNIRKMGK